jgi:hypothetical protein
MQRIAALSYHIPETNKKTQLPNVFGVLLSVTSQHNMWDRKSETEFVKYKSIFSPYYQQDPENRQQ